MLWFVLIHYLFHVLVELGIAPAQVLAYLLKSQLVNIHVYLEVWVQFTEISHVFNGIGEFASVLFCRDLFHYSLALGLVLPNF